MWFFDLYVDSSSEGIEMVVKLIINDQTQIPPSGVISNISLNQLLNNKMLTPRELDVLKLLVVGCTAKKTAKVLGISFRTVETYVDKLKSKLGCASKCELLEMMLCQLLR